jgi:hypothetical protein
VRRSNSGGDCLNWGLRREGGEGEGGGAVMLEHTLLLWVLLYFIMPWRTLNCGQTYC